MVVIIKSEAFHLLLHVLEYYLLSLCLKALSQIFLVSFNDVHLQIQIWWEVLNFSYFQIDFSHKNVDIVNPTESLIAVVLHIWGDNFDLFLSGVVGFQFFLYLFEQLMQVVSVFLVQIRFCVFR